MWFGLLHVSGTPDIMRSHMLYLLHPSNSALSRCLLRFASRLSLCPVIMSVSPSARLGFSARLRLAS